jgi:centrosomal protein CEP104
MSTGIAAAAGGAINSSLVKLGYRVVSASSSDIGYDETQLEQQSTHTKGWQSARFPSYPQHLILQFQQIFDIRKIQILSHQSKIASSIEIFTGRHSNDNNSLNHNNNNDLNNIIWQRLGYLSLDNNERSQFKARELKSVYVNARGSHLKLSIKKCHKNAINMFDQVGVIAINVVGNKSGDALAPIQHSAAVSNSAGPDFSAEAALSGSSEGLLDAQTEAKLAELQRSKNAAIAAEDYDTAKQLKVVIDSIRRVTNELSALERRKRQAISEEDYDQAKICKKQIDLLRNKALNGQFDAASAQNSRADSNFPAEQAEFEANQQNSEYSDQRPLKSKPRSVEDEPPGGDDRPIRGQKSSAPAAELAYDERPIGGKAASPKAPKNSRKSAQNNGEERPIKSSKARDSLGDEEFAGLSEGNYDDPNDSRALNLGKKRSQFDEAENGAENGEEQVLAAEPLSAANRKDAEALLDCFGEEIVRCLYSKQWQLRSQGLKSVLGAVEGQALEAEPRQIFINCARIVKRGLGDKVAQVISFANALLELTLAQLAPQIRPEEVRVQLEPIITLLIEKLSSSNARERDSAASLLGNLAISQAVHPAIVVNALLAPLKKKDKDNPLPIKSRAKLLLKLTLKLGSNDNFGLNLANLGKFALGNVNHKDAAVRDAMYNIVAALVQLLGRAKVEPHLKELRGSILESLNQRLEDVAAGRINLNEENEGKNNAGPTNFTEQKLQKPQQIAPNVAKQPPAKKPAAKPAQVPQPQQDPAPRQAKPAAAAKKLRAVVEKPAKSAGNKANITGKAATPRDIEESEQFDVQEPADYDDQLSARSNQPEISVSTKIAGDLGNYSSNLPDQYNSTNLAEESYSDLQGKCQFCGIEDPSFTEEKLDLHYWQDCPMLNQCSNCEQVIEIPTLTEHLLNECEAPNKHVQCTICQLAVPQSQLSAHHKGKNCRKALPISISNRCPLCAQDIPNGEDGWKQHLLVQGCPNNTRKPIA